MTNAAIKLPGRVALDLARLVQEGTLSVEEALRLRDFALPDRAYFRLANVMFIFGAFIAVAGILALQPPLDAGLALALFALGAGGFLVFRARDEWGLLGQALVLMGVLGLSGWASLRFVDLGGIWPHLTAPVIAVLTLTSALVFRNAVLAVLAPLALANLLGAGTDYWHACYGLYVEAPTVTILVFGTLAAGLLALRERLPGVERFNAILMARVSFILANFGFWIGSLWGDHVGRPWFAPHTPEHYSKEAWQAWRLAWDAWQSHALFVPDIVFAAGWAVVLAVSIYVGVRLGRRFISNTAIVFLAIHLYTQFFERLNHLPAAIVVAGLSLVALGFGLVRFDRWQRARIATKAPT